MWKQFKIQEMLWKNIQELLVKIKISIKNRIFDNNLNFFEKIS